MNIYVGNLSHQVTEEDLRQAFETFGEVTSAKIIADKFSGVSRGFGFVEMAQASAAQEAINQLNGRKLGGRGIRVRMARLPGDSTTAAPPPTPAPPPKK